MRAAKKSLRLLLLALVIGAFAKLLWPHIPEIREYLGLFGSSSADTSEIDGYYEALSKHGPPGKGLVLDLGMKAGDDLQAAIDRMKLAMGLPGNRIWLAHHDAENPPAYIKQLGYGDMGILISRSIKDRHEELSLLVHELGHIYVWRLDPSVFGRFDQEKLVDCAGIYLGLGIIALNVITDRTSITPGGYETTHRSFGYLKPGQFGYLLARYCAEGGIPQAKVRSLLNPSARKYFDEGSRQVERAARPALPVSGRAGGISWDAARGMYIEKSI